MAYININCKVFHAIINDNKSANFLEKCRNWRHNGDHAAQVKSHKYNGHTWRMPQIFINWKKISCYIFHIGL